MAKKYTVLVIPQGTNNVKNFSIPIWIIPALMAVLICSITLCVYWYHQYFKMVEKMPDQVALEQNLQRQETQIQDIAKTVNNYKKQMGKIQVFNRRLRILANLEKPGDLNEAILGVGGNQDSGTGPGVRLSQSAQDRQLMNIRRDLDALRIATEDERGIQEELAKFLQERRSIIASTPSIWPTRGWVTSNYGYLHLAFYRQKAVPRRPGYLHPHRNARQGHRGRGDHLCGPQRRLRQDDHGQPRTRHGHPLRAPEQIQDQKRPEGKAGRGHRSGGQHRAQHRTPPAL